jgi:hypothetical protein
LIHELIDLGEPPCDFLLVHSNAKTGKSPSDLAIVLWWLRNSSQQSCFSKFARELPEDSSCYRPKSCVSRSC